MPNTKQGLCPKVLLALGQWQNNIRGTKGAESQIEVLVLFGFSEQAELAVWQADGKVQHAKSHHGHKGTLRPADSIPG